MQAWLLRSPPVLLLLLIAVHLTLVASVRLSPWLGGGFGMFATPDERHLAAYAVDAEGGKTELALPDALHEDALRAHGLPSPARLRALADDLALATGRSPDSIRLEIWRSAYDPRTLRVRGEPLAAMGPDGGGR